VGPEARHLGSLTEVYRVLKADGLLPDRGPEQRPAGQEFTRKSQRPNRLWQSDATRFSIPGWGYCWLASSRPALRGLASGSQATSIGELLTKPYPVSPERLPAVGPQAAPEDAGGEEVAEGEADEGGDETAVGPAAEA
jgi:hypothetical protein